MGLRGAALGRPMRNPASANKLRVNGDATKPCSFGTRAAAVSFARLEQSTWGYSASAAARKPLKTPLSST
eukprot:8815225-Lingulodinium_polyedra.AAC.1